MKQFTSVTVSLLLPSPTRVISSLPAKSLTHRTSAPGPVRDHGPNLHFQKPSTSLPKFQAIQLMENYYYTQLSLSASCSWLFHYVEEIDLPTDFHIYQKIGIFLQTFVIFLIQILHALSSHFFNMIHRQRGWRIQQKEKSSFRKGGIGYKCETSGKELNEDNYSFLGLGNTHFLEVLSK